MSKKIFLPKKQVLPGRYGVIGKSPLLQDVFEKIEKLARNDTTVLITGPTGCGKELIARAIHAQSPRKHRSFIAVNCGGIPADLFESELFGHEKGAFTSALEAKPGKFELAQGGTLFLDEIGNLPLSLQAKLLRALQEKEVERIGSLKPKVVDIRIVAATNADLKKEAAEGKFRSDLYHRLNVVPLAIPPLSARTEDIAYLTAFFLKQFGQKYHNSFTAIEPKALQALKQYPWPGNIRELKHLLERITALEAGPILRYEHLPLDFHVIQHSLYRGDNLKEILENFAKNVIVDTLHNYRGNQTKAARFLGIKRTTLLSKMRQYKLEAVFCRN